MCIIYCLSASDNFCCLLITFANNVDPSQAQQSLWPDLDPNFLKLIVFISDFWKYIILKKKLAYSMRSYRKSPSMQKDRTKELSKCYIFALVLCLNF